MIESNKESLGEYLKHINLMLKLNCSMLLFREKHFLKRVKSWDRITKMKYLHKRHEDTQIISPKTFLLKMTITICVLQSKSLTKIGERERERFLDQY